MSRTKHFLVWRTPVSVWVTLGWLLAAPLSVPLAYSIGWLIADPTNRAQFISIDKPEWWRPFYMFSLPSALGVAMALRILWRRKPITSGDLIWQLLLAAMAMMPVGGVMLFVSFAVERGKFSLQSASEFAWDAFTLLWGGAVVGLAFGWLWIWPSLIWAIFAVRLSAFRLMPIYADSVIATPDSTQRP